MTKIQIKFLKCIYKGDKTAEELCKKLNIPGNKNDEIGGYYNALNVAIDYLTSDEGNEIDGMFRIKPNSTPYPNKDVYNITREGKEYIEKYNDSQKIPKAGMIIGILVVIAVVLFALIK